MKEDPVALVAIMQKRMDRGRKVVQKRKRVAQHNLQIVTRCKSLKLSIAKALKHPRTIVLPTMLTFSILTGAGLFAIFYSCHQYRERQSQQLLDESRDLAYLLDDLLSKALLPLFTLKEMAGQFQEFTDLRQSIDDYDTYYRDGERAFRDVTSVCTKKEFTDLYWKAAESIAKGSRMDDTLLHIQLQPGRLTFPDALSHFRTTYSLYADCYSWHSVSYLSTRNELHRCYWPRSDS